MLPWSHDMMATFASALRALKKNGLFIFTTVGLDTLKELRQAFASVDAQDHVNAFYDMHEIFELIQLIQIFMQQVLIGQYCWQRY